jgi:hypothetical protein
MRKTTTALIAVMALMLAATPAFAHGRSHRDRGIRHDLATAARVSARYHNVNKAKRDGFEPFAIPEEVGGTLMNIRGDDITCFDSDTAGGMGVHYVRNIDDTVDPADPEALVYQVGRHGRLRLVALEYIIPEEFVGLDGPPVLFGQTMHHHSYLPVYILHVWIWKWNPSGLFADFNPRVRDCPSS